MADADDSAKPRTQRKPNGNRWGPRLVAYLKRKAHERKAKNKKETPEPRSIRWTMWSTVAIAVFTVVLACVSYFQLREMKQAGVESGGQMNQMIEQSRRQAAQISRQADETHELAGKMKLQADQTKIIAKQAVTQAGAAKSAAETAKEALHVSERAYITVGDPALDFSQKFIIIKVVNSGRIPSGAIDIVGHEATYNRQSLNSALIWHEAAEKHWQRTKFPPISTSVPMELKVAAPAMSEEVVKGGLQTIIVAGFVSYNDGFDDSPERRQPFCVQTMYHTIAKNVFVSPCDASIYLPEMEREDGYPNNEQTQ